MYYVINNKLLCQIEIWFGLHYLRKMEESGSDHSSLSSTTDNESLYSSYDSLVSEDNDTGHFPSLSLDTEVLPYQFEPEPSTEPTTDVSLLTNSIDEPPRQLGNTDW